MTTTHPHYVYGFVKRCRERGLDERSAAAALDTAQLQENLNDPDYREGWNKRAAVLDTLKKTWDGMGPGGKGALVGAGVGGVGGLVFGGRNRLRNGLVGGLLGAGVGGLAGRNPGVQNLVSSIAKRFQKAPPPGPTSTDRTSGPALVGELGDLQKPDTYAAGNGAYVKDTPETLAYTSPIAELRRQWRDQQTGKNSLGMALAGSPTK